MKRIMIVVALTASLNGWDNANGDALRDLERIGGRRGPQPTPFPLPATRDPSHIGGIVWKEDRFEYVTYGQIKPVPVGKKRTYTENEATDITLLRDPFRVIDGRVENITRVLQQFEARSITDTNGWHRITGKVLQNLGADGLLISTYRGNVRVRGCQWANQLVDNSSFRGIAKANGIFRYKAVSGATTTVPSYEYGAMPDTAQWGAIHASIEASKSTKGGTANARAMGAR